jgi:hypothetical protein
MQLPKKQPLKAHKKEGDMDLMKRDLISKTGISGKFKKILYPVVFILWAAVIASCAHYPVNEPLKQVDPQSGYRVKYMAPPRKLRESGTVSYFLRGRDTGRCNLLRGSRRASEDRGGHRWEKTSSSG